MGKQRVGTCVYCGKSGRVTSDHVPPKCLFPPHARVNLMTVPACPGCHDTFKLDDEYFRLILAVRADLPRSESATFLREQTKRSLRSPEAAGLRSAVRAATVQAQVKSSDEAAVRSGLGLRVEAGRIVRTSDRMVRGMFPKFFGRILPPDYESCAILLDLQRDDSALTHPHVQEALELVGENGIHRSFVDVLDVWACLAKDDENSSMWVVELHGVFGFIGYTCPRGTA